VRPWLSGGWHAGRGGSNQVLGALAGAVHVVLSLPDALLVLCGVTVPKRLRLQATVLRDGDGRPVVPPEALQAAVDVAVEVFREQAGVRVVLRSASPVVVPEPAPAAALHVPCRLPLLVHGLTAGSSFLRRHTATNAGTLLLGYGSPVTVFAVAGFTGSRPTAGCSLGPLADWVVVAPRGLSRRREELLLTVAHEVGHACNLSHLRSAGTLMQPGPAGRTRRLTRWQKALLRTSRHVTLL
jgi:hypothetical protein